MIEMEPTFIFKKINEKKRNVAGPETLILYRKHMDWKGEKPRQKQISECVVCLLKAKQTQSQVKW